MNGLFTLPYTVQDWIIISFAIAGTILRISIMYRQHDAKNPTFKEWVSILITSFILTIGLYEMAINKGWEIENLYFPFAILIIVSKDIVDWLFMTEDGKNFIIKTFKSLITGLAKKIISNEENTINSTNPDNVELRDKESANEHDKTNA